MQIIPNQDILTGLHPSAWMFQSNPHTENVF